MAETSAAGAAIEPEYAWPPFAALGSGPAYAPTERLTPGGIRG
ncbi:hypothetical protein [Streptomyces sp. NPDC020298]